MIQSLERLILIIFGIAIWLRFEHTVKICPIFFFFCQILVFAASRGATFITMLFQNIPGHAVCNYLC